MLEGAGSSERAQPASAQTALSAARVLCDVVALGALTIALAATPATAAPIKSRGGAPTGHLGAGRVRHAAPLLTGFLSEPTDQIAAPGMRASAEITPEGNLYTGWAEYDLRFGRKLRRWDQKTRSLPHPSQPLIASVLDDGAVRYRLTIFAIPLAGMPVAYETLTASNSSSRTQMAKASMSISYSLGRKVDGPHGLPTGEFRYERPAAIDTYQQPGQSFSSSFRYSVQGRDLLRSGLLLARGPVMRSTPMPTRQGGGWRAPHDERLFATRLPAHAHASLTWQIPLEPPSAGQAADDTLDATPRAAALSAFRGIWHASEAHLTKIEVPERKVVSTYEASIAEMMLSRYRTPRGWMQTPNRLQYDSFWIRDAAIESEALDLAGLHRPAVQDLSFLQSFQQPSGLFISQEGQYDGVGEALWALSRHAQLSASPGYAAATLPRIALAIGWLQSATAQDPLGLLPTASPHDNELASGHLTGDDLWAAAGLRAAIADAKLAGRDELASAWQATDVRFEASLLSAIDAAAAREGHVPPVLDSARGQDWGNYWASYPVEVLGARSRLVQETLRWARSHMAEGLPTYMNGRFLHDYLGFRIFQTELAAKQVRCAVEGLYAELAHTTSTYAGWETDVRPFGGRAPSSNLAPHGTFAAEYVALLRDMLISESGDGSVHLLPGASPAWLAPGTRISVRGAPVSGGAISFTERATRTGESLSWEGRLPKGAKLLWTLPAWASHMRTPAGSVVKREVPLEGRSGSIAILFSGRRPRESYERTARALNAKYRAHGRSAPLVLSACSRTARRRDSSSRPSSGTCQRASGSPR